MSDQTKLLAIIAEGVEAGFQEYESANNWDATDGTLEARIAQAVLDALETQHEQIRHHLEHIRNGHESDHSEATGLAISPYCIYCESRWPCPDYEYASAALALLGDATTQDAT